MSLFGGIRLITDLTMTSLGFIGLLLGLILLATCLLVLYSLLEIVWRTHCIEGHAVGAWAVGFFLLLAGVLVFRSEARMEARGIDPSSHHSIWVNWDSFLLLTLGLIAFVVGVVMNIRHFDRRLDTQEDLLERLKEDEDGHLPQGQRPPGS